MHLLLQQFGQAVYVGLFEHRDVVAGYEADGNIFRDRGPAERCVVVASVGDVCGAIEIQAARIGTELVGIEVRHIRVDAMEG